MYNEFDEKRFKSFQKLLGKGDAKKNISISLRADMIDRIDELSKKKKKISGNNITRNAIIEEGISIYVQEFEDYLDNIYSNYEDSGKYIDDKMKLEDKRGKTKMLEEKK